MPAGRARRSISLIRNGWWKDSDPPPSIEENNDELPRFSGRAQPPGPPPKPLLPEMPMKHAFASRYLSAGRQSVLILHLKDFIHKLAMVGLWDKSRADALNTIGPRLSSRKEPATFPAPPLQSGHPGSGSSDILPAADRATGSNPSHKDINFSFRILPDFRPRRRLAQAAGFAGFSNCPRNEGMGNLFCQLLRRAIAPLIPLRLR